MADTMVFTVQGTAKKLSENVVRPRHYKHASICVKLKEKGKIPSLETFVE